jgi:MFS family permease
MLSVLLMAPLLYQADATVVNVATPAIRHGLGASAAAAELVISGYLITSAALMITGARLGHTHGYKRMFGLGIAVFGTGSLVAGFAPDATVLVTMRLLQGIGGALMFPQVLTGIQLNFTGRQRARAVSFYAIALACGAVLGQLLGGVLVSADIAGASWRPVFLINVPVCLAVLAAARRYLPADGQRQPRGLDLPGVAALTVSLVLIVLPLTLGRGLGWPTWAWACLAAAIPAFAVFLAVQRRAAAAGRQPLVSTTMLARAPVTLALSALLAATGTYYALLFVLAQYIQAGLGRSALVSGLVLIPWVAAFGAAGQLARRLPARSGPYLPAAGYLLLTAAYAGIAALQSAGQGPGVALLALLGLGGLGLGIGFTTLVGHLTSAVSTRYAPDISGVATTTMQIGGAIGVAVFGSIYLGLAGLASPAQASHAFAITSLALAATGLVATAAACLATHCDVGR